LDQLVAAVQNFKCPISARPPDARPQETVPVFRINPHQPLRRIKLDHAKRLQDCAWLRRACQTDRAGEHVN
jgi:hypothetical protein